MTCSKNTSIMIVFCYVILFVISQSAQAWDNEDIRLHSDPNSSCIWGFTHAGYSDYFIWANSNRHLHSAHEMLSGEFAAGIFWENCGSNEAIWLTDWFEAPTFPTGTIFGSYGTPPFSRLDDPNNPVNNYDTGYAVIRDNQNRIQIRMDYEVVDLGETGYSPLVFIDANEVGYVKSEQWVILATYTIKNVSASNITGLEFYQMLVGLSSWAEHSSYTTAGFQDYLADYIPYNPVHKAPGSDYAGNFRYDLTQWGTYSYDPNDIDYVGFSSTVEPDAFENDIFTGKDTGTYEHIENRILNGQTYSTGEVAGAMKWNLGTLGPQEFTSLTLAIMFGCGERYMTGLWVEKQDDIAPENCVNPASEDPNDYTITYRIDYGNTGFEPEYNCVLVDELPLEVDYPQSGWTVQYTGDPNDPNYPQITFIPPDPAYDPETHSLSWNLGTLFPSDSGFIEITVHATQRAAPGSIIHNVAKLYSDEALIVQDTEDTLICCWDETDPNIIYVDKAASGHNNGTSWTDAYTDLQDGLARATESDCEEIYTLYVAQGTYTPGSLETSYFRLPNGVSVYGGFPAGGCDFANRNPTLHKTILSGTIDETSRNETVVAIGDNALLSGVVVTDSSDFGIYGVNADFVLEHCAVLENEGFGVYTENATPTIKNSVVANCAQGIELLNPVESPVLFNNTIVLNDCGIAFSDNHNSENDSNNLDYPDIQNCLVYFNSGGQLANLDPDMVAAYCCIQDCNELPGLTNINDNPQFAYTDANNLPTGGNYHLAWSSPCKDTGNPNHDNGDVGMFDTDFLERIINNRVDIGADEIDCEDVSNPLDWNADGFVNLHEFSVFAAAWLSHDPNDPEWVADPNLADPNLSGSWNPICNLDATENTDTEFQIDLADLIAWVDDTPWLWTACYNTEAYQSQMQMMMLPSAGENMLMMESSALPMEMTAVEELPVIEEKSIEEQVLDIQDAIDFLEQIWMEEPDIQQEIDAADWQEFMDAVYQSLTDLQSQTMQIE